MLAPAVIRKLRSGRARGARLRRSPSRRRSWSSSVGVARGLRPTLGRRAPRGRRRRPCGDRPGSARVGRCPPAAPSSAVAWPAAACAGRSAGRRAVARRGLAFRRDERRRIGIERRRRPAAARPRRAGSKVTTCRARRRLGGGVRLGPSPPVPGGGDEDAAAGHQGGEGRRPCRAADRGGRRSARCRDRGLACGRDRLGAAGAFGASRRSGRCGGSLKSQRRSSLASLVGALDDGRGRARAGDRRRRARRPRCRCTGPRGRGAGAAAARRRGRPRTRRARRRGPRLSAPSGATW